MSLIVFLPYQTEVISVIYLNITKNYSLINLEHVVNYQIFKFQFYCVWTQLDVFFVTLHWLWIKNVTSFKSCHFKYAHRPIQFQENDKKVLSWHVRKRIIVGFSGILIAFHLCTLKRLFLSSLCLWKNYLFSCSCTKWNNSTPKLNIFVCIFFFSPILTCETLLQY